MLVRVGARVDFRLLGSVAAVAADGQELALGSPKRRSLLAMLLLNPGAPVGVDRLTEALWEEEPPRHARTVIHNHVSGLRAVLAAHRAPAAGVELATDGSGGYLLRAPETAVDTQRFERLVRTARTAPEAGHTVTALRRALALWRGPALAGTAPSLPLQCAAQALEELRLTAVEELARAHGRLGDHGAAAAVLATEAALNPLREPLVAALVLALGRAGRRSEALEWYHRTRRTLAEQLGIDPGAELAQAYGVLLRGDGAGAPVPVPVAPVVPVPAGPAPWPFPRRPRGFSGR
ncbi:AfsR/SARP family transcriptional regulator, partial [Streptomyces sp. CBMA123]|uniref:AfsR/SARP family transcriptional regulator n=1 Tax=Streptomyces sp. CBMA123 TaxID=1896313 RepID=UPI001CB804E7